MSLSSFAEIFRALTDNDPFPWQEKLFARLAAGDLPRHCDVPTGLGKTSVIVVWLAALGASLLEPARYGRVPRRLAYVVDRRVVVDQATEEVKGLRDRLAQAQQNESLTALRPIIAALKKSATVPEDCGVTISTLRGQFADNHAWHLDPSRPAIVVGTVDMIGSRMLFAGYGGVGRNWRSLQAGLLLQDTWVVLDEAHLVPPFAHLLQDVERYAGSGILLRPFGITQMSATLATAHAENPSKVIVKEEPLFGPDDCNNDEVAKRLNAAKALRFVISEAAAGATKDAEKRAALAERMAHEAIALAEGKNAVVVFANTVDLVKAVTAALEKGIAKELRERILPLTGEMRGAERDKLAKNAVLKAFWPKRERTSVTLPAFLVATACVEVGMDFDADHAVCDAVTIERVIQRLGRVNRRGEGNARIHLVLSSDVAEPKADQIEKMSRSDAAVLTLRQLPPNGETFDASPAALRALDLTSALAQHAHSRASVSPPLDEARLDDWSLTSLRPDEFPRPKVSYWLRGVTEDDSMTTSLVWRSDLCFATNEKDAESMVDAIPIAPNEVAQVATHRVAALLIALGKKDAHSLLVIRSANDESRGVKAGEFDDAKKSFRELASATVFLPSNAGGMLKDIPDSSADALKVAVKDVVKENAWQRAVFVQTGKEIHASLLLPTGETEPLETYADETEARNGVVKSLQSRHPEMLIRFEKLVGVLSVVDEDADEFQRLEQSVRQAVAYFQLTADGSEGSDEDNRSLAKRAVTLAEHSRVAEAVARTLGERLGISPDLREAIWLAARWHDRGKDRRWWQAAIGNPTGEALAKSDKSYFDHSLNKGYRHEFGSLIEARADATLHDHPQRELIFHLIAAHHGYARPSFPPESYDHSIPSPECAAIAEEVSGRFVELQQQYGWWTLAWLEALVKCADAIASADSDWTAK